MTVKINYRTRLLVGLKISCQLFNQWETPPNPIAPCTLDFSRALSRLQVIVRNSDWFISLFAPVVKTNLSLVLCHSPITANVWRGTGSLWVDVLSLLGTVHFLRGRGGWWDFGGGGHRKKNGGHVKYYLYWRGGRGKKFSYWGGHANF